MVERLVIFYYFLKEERLVKLLLGIQSQCKWCKSGDNAS